MFTSNDGTVSTPTDLPIQIPDQELLNRIRRETSQSFVDGLTNAGSLGDFVLNYYALKFLSGRSDNDSFRFFLGSDISVDSARSSLLTEQLEAQTTSDTRAIEDLAPVLDLHPTAADKVTMVLKRIRDKSGRYTYGILARLPEDKLASTLSGTPEKGESSDVVYFASTSACALNASDDLFRMHRKEAFDIDFADYWGALRELKGLQGGMAHYEVDRSSDQALQADAGNYLLFGIHGGYGNEPYVVPVSRFQPSSENPASA